MGLTDLSVWSAARVLGSCEAGGRGVGRLFLQLPLSLLRYPRSCHLVWLWWCRGVPRGRFLLSRLNKSHFPSRRCSCPFHRGESWGQPLGSRRLPSPGHLGSGRQSQRAPLCLLPSLLQRWPSLCPMERGWWQNCAWPQGLVSSKRDRQGAGRKSRSKQESQGGGSVGPAAWEAEVGGSPLPGIEGQLGRAARPRQK